MPNKKPLYANNLNYLARRKGLTRERIYELTGIPISSWGSYVEGRAFPNHIRLPVICAVLDFYDIYALLTTDLSQRKTETAVSPREAREGLLKVRQFLEALK